MDLINTILPVVTKDLPISPRFTPYDFLSRCKFSTLATRQPMVELYLLTFPRFALRKKEHKSYFGKNRTHDFRTSRCAGYLLLVDHSGDEVDQLIYASLSHTHYSSLLFCYVWWLCMAINVSVQQYNGGILLDIILLCVCVCCLPIHSGHQVRWTYQPGSHMKKVTQDF